MQCSIISTESKRRFVKVQGITLPAYSGELQILPSHAESFIVLRSGNIVLENEKTNTIPIEAGICGVKDDVVTIIL